MSASKSFLLAAAIALLAAPAFAETRADEVNQRIVNQDQRIEQGVESGQLTDREANRLEKHETKIGADVEKAQSDGKVTKREAHKLNREEDRQSQRIHHQKHDGQSKATTH